MQYIEAGVAVKALNTHDIVDSIVRCFERWQLMVVDGNSLFNLVACGFSGSHWHQGRHDAVGLPATPPAPGEQHTVLKQGNGRDTCGSTFSAALSWRWSSCGGAWFGEISENT
jgi:hypothetical protein